MKELPREYFLKTLLSESKVSKNDFNDIALKLTRFYNSQSPDPRVCAYGDPENIKRDVYESISLSRDFTGKTVSDPALSAVEFYNDRFFEIKSGLFRDRMEGNFIKDCHGDLHLEHINIRPEGINIYDCIEFNERFRYIDIASDTAFLAMDLDYNGYGGFARHFISRVSELMPDKGIYRLLDFYKCYRALVRGKVLSIKAYEPEVPDSIREQALQNAKRYYKLALTYALLGSRPSLLVTCGSIGTGKSTLANNVSNELSCQVISSDALRKEKAGSEPVDRHYDAYESGLYSKEITEDTYAELALRGIQIVNSGECAVLDASFSKQKWRELIKCSATKHNIPVYFIQTLAPISVVRERLLQRELMGGSVSDGRLEILDRFTRDFEEPRELVGWNLIKVDTTKSEQEQIMYLFKRLVHINTETEHEFG